LTTPDGDRVHPKTAQEWRAWLDENHETSSGVWLVSWKKHTGRPTVGYEEAVTEALAVGWVDSKGKRLDDDRTMLYLTRRRPTSGWSRPNKERVERLLAAGRMGPAGQAAIDAAKENGTWSLRRGRREGWSRRAGSPVTTDRHSCALRTTRSCRSELPLVSFAKYTAMTVMTDARAT
jgi:uncharacterized protein YdeI (YjbR/CyaY-like superfamily)